MLSLSWSLECEATIFPKVDFNNVEFSNGAPVSNVDATLDTHLLRKGQLVDVYTHVGADAPSVVEVGRTWLDTDDNSFQVWNGSSWVTITGGGGGGSDKTYFPSGWN